MSVEEYDGLEQGLCDGTLDYHGPALTRYALLWLRMPEVATRRLPMRWVPRHLRTPENWPDMRRE